MRLKSRLSGVERELDETPIVPSMYSVAGEPGIRVVPAGVATEENPVFIGGWPEPIDLLAVERVVEGLREPASWRTWGGTLPLVPRLGDAARLQPLDRAIARNLPHLQFVCHRPRLQLRIEEERLPISRARRIPERATAMLVAHPEDWDHRTLKSIRPGRVLARLVEDQWDLYENRVAVRLVDHLLKYVGQRVEELRRFKGMFDDATDFADDTRGSFRRGQRLFDLWGRYFADNALNRELEESLGKLERIHRDLQALLDSPLYQEVPRNRSIAVNLQATNILVNDPHYRKVAELWRDWAKDGHVAQPTSEELRRRRQAECRSFDLFGRLVFIRALEAIGCTPTASRPLSSEGAIQLTCRWGCASFAWVSEGEMALGSGSRRLRVIPVLSGLAAEDQASLWRQLANEARDDVLLVLLGRRSDILTDDSEVQLALNGWDSPMVQLISPWSIDSAERVARSIGAWLSRSSATTYPPSTTVRPDPGVTLPHWLLRNGDAVRAVAPPLPVELASFEAACATRRGELVQEQERARQARRAFDPGNVHALGPLLDVARQAENLVALAQCPVCATDARQGFQPRVASGSPPAWWCRCSSCNAEWGLRVCGTCREAYPVLVPAMLERHPGGESPDPSWVDRYYGRDIWAEPCWRADRGDKFRCAKCKSCAGGGCIRCVIARSSQTAPFAPDGTPIQGTRR